MRKNIWIMAAVLGASLVCTSAFAAVSVEENPDSATGYTVSFSFEDPNAVNVQVMGSFDFSLASDEHTYAGGVDLEEGDSVSNYYVAPEDWTAEADLWHISDASCIRDMDGSDGVWTYSLDLPGGSYLYKFKVTYDGEIYQDLTDPDNPADCNRYGSHQDRSQFYVPYDAEKQNPNDDFTWLTPAENEADRGTRIHLAYPSADGRTKNTEIYLPAGYDADREEPYKVLYLSHGGGGEEGDWIYQGNAGNILDRLVAEGACEPFIIVAMNNTVFSWDYDAIFENTKDYLIPYIEAHYNVSAEASGRAFAGLSMGGMTTSEMYYRDPSLFGYFGVFSGASTAAFPVLDDYSAYKEPQMYLAAGWADMALKNSSYQTETDRTTVGLADKLDELGIAYNGGNGIYLVQGSHDWFTWPQIIKDYFANYLWK